MCNTGDSVYPASTIVSIVSSGLSRVQIKWQDNDDSTVRSSRTQYTFCDSVTDAGVCTGDGDGTIDCPVSLAIGGRMHLLHPIEFGVWF